jgi:hypothetical protein
MALVVLGTNPLQAEEHRQHDAHEHGAAKLGMAQEGTVIQIELDSPAFNIVGFEHAPSSAAEKDKVALLMAQLEAGSMLFGFPLAAKCQLDKFEISSNLLDAVHVADHEQSSDSGHSDIEASWTYSCGEPALVGAVAFPLFLYFENLLDLDVDFIMDAGQGSVELSPANSVISF